jgi:hypothetical protein
MAAGDAGDSDKVRSEIVWGLNSGWPPPYPKGTNVGCTSSRTESRSGTEEIRVSGTTSHPGAA